MISFSTAAIIWLAAMLVIVSAELADKTAKLDAITSHINDLYDERALQLGLEPR